MTGTEVTTDTIEEYATKVVASYFDAEISQEFIKRYAKDNSINDFKQIIGDIISEYKTKIEKNEWLGEKTKQKALLKLENMKVNVGYPNKWKENSYKYNISNNLLDNIINMNKVNTDYANNSIINKEKYWMMSPLTVNAYYNLMNKLEAKLTGTEVTTDTIEEYATKVVASYCLMKKAI